jgi:hypothetical protein
MLIIFLIPILAPTAPMAIEPMLAPVSAVYVMATIQERNQKQYCGDFQDFDSHRVQR